jgi:hypothetical protein
MGYATLYRESIFHIHYHWLQCTQDTLFNLKLKDVVARVIACRNRRGTKGNENNRSARTTFHHNKYGEYIFNYTRIYGALIRINLPTLRKYKLYHQSF